MGPWLFGCEWKCWWRIWSSTWVGPSKPENNHHTWLLIDVDPEGFGESSSLCSCFRIWNHQNRVLAWLEWECYSCCLRHLKRQPLDLQIKLIFSRHVALFKSSTPVAGASNVFLGSMHQRCSKHFYGRCTRWHSQQWLQGCNSPCATKYSLFCNQERPSKDPEAPLNYYSGSTTSLQG